MTAPLYGLGRLCVRHRVPVILLWIVVVVVLGALGRDFGQQTYNDLTLPGTDSQAAQDLLSDRFPAQAYGTNPIAFEAPAGHQLTQQRYRKPIDQVTKAYGTTRPSARRPGPSTPAATTSSTSRRPSASSP